MRFISSIVAASVILAEVVAGAKVPRAFGVPTNDGFPNPSPQQILDISQRAKGRLPDGATPTSLPPNTITALQLIAFNELFETAFFTSLINNITSGADGYQDAPSGALAILTAVQAQEELHALGAISILQTAGAFAPSPCQYQFPVAKLGDAVALAETFTAVVLGALQNANVIFGQDGLSDFVRLVSSVIGQEGEQNGFYRLLLNRIPSEKPFLTTVPPPFAFSALQLFVVPGSCPFPLSNINLPIFPTLATNGGPVALIQPNDQTLSFQADLSTSEAAKQYIGGDGSGLYMTYTTGQQQPFSVSITNVQWQGSVISFSATFPFSSNQMNGFSHGALTTTNNPSSLDALVQCTLAAPAVIQVNDSIL
ncbi:unnamed protein product [Clonostachys solani]|uniref:Sexual development protein n=1 Tax=Clonostachys solani TaxID=160281 RepID=A0A9N9ZPX5_9HYPO|nr:unnamed protein product [Clonostachys solani]